jgi:hypothetical protein
MLEHIILAIVLIIISVSFLGIRVVKARFMYVDLKDPETLLPDKPFRSHLIMEGIIYIVIAFIVRPSLDALWAWKSLIFVFFLFVGCWALIHGILIVRLCKRREMEKG